MDTHIPIIVDGQAGIFAHSKAKIAELNARAKERLCLMDARMRKGLSRWLARLPPVHNEGAATAEFAVVLPSVIAITGVLLTLTRVVAVSMDCQSAATASARELVVSDDESAAQQAAVNIVGSRVDVTVHQEGSLVRVAVECPVLPGPLNVTPTRVHGEAVAARQ